MKYTTTLGKELFFVWTSICFGVFPSLSQVQDPNKATSAKAKAAAKASIAKVRESHNGTKANCKAKALELKLCKKEVSELKRSLRNHRHRQPESEFSAEYSEIISSKKAPKMKNEDRKGHLF